MSTNGCVAVRPGLDPCTISKPKSAEPVQEQRQGVLILAILSMLMAFASISTDLYLPALPVMGRALHAGAGTIELTISGYLIGFSVGQLFWGPIADRYGRRLPVALGLLLFIVGSAGCALSGDATTLIAWRSVQAVGACASVVLARAMVRDLYEGARAARMLSTLITVMAIAPLVGPSVGGLILRLASWRAIFWALVAVGVLTLASLQLLPETLRVEDRSRESIRTSFARYVELLRHRRLLAYAGAGAFFYGGVYAYIAGTPFAVISYYHVSPQAYGLLFAAGILGIMATNQINGRLVGHLGSDQLLRLGTYGAAMAAAWSVIAAMTGWGGLAGLMTPLFLFVAANGFIVANSMAGALGISAQRAGAVSALIGSLQYGCGILGSALVGLCANGTPQPMAWTIAVFGVGSLICVRLLPRPKALTHTALQGETV